MGANQAHNSGINGNNNVNGSSSNCSNISSNLMPSNNNHNGGQHGSPLIYKTLRLEPSALAAAAASGGNSGIGAGTGIANGIGSGISSGCSINKNSTGGNILRLVKQHPLSTELKKLKVRNRDKSHGNGNDKNYDDNVDNNDGDNGLVDEENDEQNGQKQEVKNDVKKAESENENGLKRNEIIQNLNGKTKNKETGDKVKLPKGRQTGLASGTGPSASEGFVAGVGRQRETAADRSLMLTQEHLYRKETRVLTDMGGLFYAGIMKPLQPPDVYAITLDGERGNKSHIMSREEIFKDTVSELVNVRWSMVTYLMKLCFF